MKGEINLALFLCSIVFGISSWVVFSGIWVETPLLLQILPEGWRIPSMMNAVSQLAQIGPILLFLLKCKCVSCFHGKWAKRMRRHEVADRWIIYALFVIGLTACVFLALFWHKTVHIFGQRTSIVFFTCVFCLAILDCTCTIVFLTYVGHFKGNYISGLYIGEGISSLLPSLFALMQGIGEEEANCNLVPTTTTNQTASISSVKLKEPRFSVSVYFWLLFGTLLVSFLAFLVLEFWPSFQKERCGNEARSSKHKQHPQRSDLKAASSLLEVNRQALDAEIRYEYDGDLESEGDENGAVKRASRSTLDKVLLNVCIVLVSFTLYGFLPGMSSYSAMPYGPEIMHLCVTLSLITQPCSSLLATFFQIKSTRNQIILLLVAFGVSSYILTASCMSPCPPLKNYWFGGYLIIFAWVVSFGLLMYLRCCITISLKKRHGEESLVWCGLLTQIGQFFGSICIYLLVDIAKLFKEGDKCIEAICS